MGINKQDLKHIAELARLRLTVAEEKQFSGQLESVLQYVEKLNEVDTKNIPITAQVSGLVNVAKSDTVLDWDREELETALGQADTENGYVKVKRIL